MPTLLVRTLVIYLLTFAVLRLMGKRQISDMQPFDLTVTLLIANLASLPMGDPGAPLLYGVIPILTLFILHRFVAWSSLKSEGLRRFVCGNPLIVIRKGVVQENVMRAASYSLGDLIEQLRLKDVFSVSEVEYAILETNGSLSVLKKAPGTEAAPASLLVTDGRLHHQALSEAGVSEKKLTAALKKAGVNSLKKLLFASLDGTMLHLQEKAGGGRSLEKHVHFVELGQSKASGKERKNEEQNRKPNEAQ